MLKHDPNAIADLVWKFHNDRWNRFRHCCNCKCTPGRPDWQDDHDTARTCRCWGVCRPVTIGTPMVIFAVLTNGTLYQSSKTVKNHWRLVHQWSFLLFWRMVHCTNRQKQSKPLVYQSSQVYQDCTNSVPIVKNSQKQWKDSENSTKMTIGVPIVTWLPRVQDCTKRVPTVYQKQSKKVKTAIMNNVCVCLCRQNAKQFSAAIQRMEIKHVPVINF